MRSLRKRLHCNRWRAKYAQGTFQKAASLISFNRSINIPPSGTQTVSGTCTPPPGAKFFVMSTHTHKYATLAEIRRGSATGEQLVRRRIR